MSRWLDSDPLLLQALRGSARPSDWQPPDWALVLEQARASGLLGRLGTRVADQLLPSGSTLPAGVEGQLAAAARLWRAQQAELQREIRFIAQALGGLGAPVVLLKGAAYGAARLRAAEGRLFSDIDILVPRSSLDQAERLLTVAGWVGVPKSEYDRQYYRRWMHELPPMEHVHRRTVLDVHHTLLPDTARLRPDAARLFEGLVPLGDVPGLFVLPPAEMVLHSLTHLFMNDELSHALRDLSDLDLLLRDFGRNADFWPRLSEAARVHGLGRLLHYALRYSSRLFGTPIPQHAIESVAPLGPPLPIRRLMDALWLNALQPNAMATSDAGAQLSLFALYVRGHWLRMPAWMLARHLGIKALGLHKDPATGRDPQAG